MIRKIFTSLPLYCIILAIVVSIFLFYMLDLKGVHTEDVNSFQNIKEPDPPTTQSTTDLSQLKRIVITDFFKQQTHTHNLSNQLKSRIQSGEFNAVWDQEYEIYDVQVFTQTDFGEIQIALIDVVLERNNDYQWIQFITTWDQDQLIDITFHHINYVERINERSGYTEAITFTKELLEELNNANSSNFGWRLQENNPMIDNLVTIKAKSLNSLGIYTPQTKPDDIEVLLISNYEIYAEDLDHNREVRALLYVKRYENKWQLENIQVLDIGELQ